LRWKPEELLAIIEKKRREADEALYSPGVGMHDSACEGRDDSG
jgi:hypothetical protein